MSASLKSLIASGTKLWLDSVDPDLVAVNQDRGATGATSNPAIISGLIKTGRFDEDIRQLQAAGQSDEEIAWSLTDQLVTKAQEAFAPTWEATGGDDGYVSFELNPLLEDPANAMPHDERVAEYLRLGKKWSANQANRMIKVPATPAGIACLEPLAAAGITLNVTLIFTPRQYEAAREAVWKGAQQLADLKQFKSVYSIFVSRIDGYTQSKFPQLSEQTQGQVGLVNAKNIWQQNRDFWRHHDTPLTQEIIFASTGTKDPKDAPWKYVEALAGSDIQTCPPETIDALVDSDQEFTNQLARESPATICQEINSKIDFASMEATLMEEGIQKFADPQRQLLQLLATKRR